MGDKSDRFIRKHNVAGGSRRNQNGSRKVVIIARERGGNPVQVISIRKAKPLHSFALASRRKRLRMPAKRHHGITDMSISRSRESAIRRHTASMARALTWLKRTPGRAEPGSAFTSTSPVRTCHGTLWSPHGVRTIARYPTAIR